MLAADEAIHLPTKKDFRKLYQTFRVLKGTGTVDVGSLVIRCIISFFIGIVNDLINTLFLSRKAYCITERIVFCGNVCSSLRSQFF